MYYERLTQFADAMEKRAEGNPLVAASDAMKQIMGMDELNKIQALNESPIDSIRRGRPFSSNVHRLINGIAKLTGNEYVSPGAGAQKQVYTKETSHLMPDSLKNMRLGGAGLNKAAAVADDIAADLRRKQRGEVSDGERLAGAGALVGLGGAGTAFASKVYTKNLMNQLSQDPKAMRQLIAVNEGASSLAERARNMGIGGRWKELKSLLKENPLATKAMGKTVLGSAGRAAGILTALGGAGMIGKGMYDHFTNR